MPRRGFTLVVVAVLVALAGSTLAQDDGGSVTGPESGTFSGTQASTGTGTLNGTHNLTGTGDLAGLLAGYANWTTRDVREYAVYTLVDDTILSQTTVLQQVINFTPLDLPGTVDTDVSHTWLEFGVALRCNPSGIASCSFTFTIAVDGLTGSDCKFEGVLNAGQDHQYYTHVMKCPANEFVPDDYIAGDHTLRVTRTFSNIAMEQFWVQAVQTEAYDINLSAVLSAALEASFTANMGGTFTGTQTTTSTGTINGTYAGNVTLDDANITLANSTVIKDMANITVQSVELAFWLPILVFGGVAIWAWRTGGTLTATFATLGILAQFAQIPWSTLATFAALLVSLWAEYFIGWLEDRKANRENKEHL